MYIRPLLMGMGPALGLGPSPEYTFLVFASPVGDYYHKVINIAITIIAFSHFDS